MKELIADYKIRRYCKRLANEISADHHTNGQSEEIVLLGVMNGAMPFLVDLSRLIDPKIPVIIDTVKCSSYTGMFTKSKVKMSKAPDNDLSYKTVIIVEDIVDTGDTMTFLVNKLNSKYNRIDLKVCSLLKRRDCRFRVDYLGRIVDEGLWLIGYGLDDDGFKRNLKSIFIK